MPVCKECKWYTPSSWNPTTLGWCRTVVEPGSIPTTSVLPDKDASNCPRFEQTTTPGKYIET